MIQHVKDLLTGFAIGTANIIPGVSGGTFLLIFGIYERVISALNNLKANVLKELLTGLLQTIKNVHSKDQRTQFVSLLTKYEILFLVKLMAGAGIAILSLSSLIKMLLHSYQTQTYGLFFGLILVSLLVPFKLFKKIKPIHILPFVVGTIATVAVATGVNPAEKLAVKSGYYEEKLTIEESEIESNRSLGYNGTYSPTELIMAGVAGAVAISAMVLPGISGSLVLILLGQYGAVLTAISGAKSFQLDSFVFLGIFSIGMGAGLLLFVKLVNFIFAKFHDGTVATLTGLIAGSLYALWPFKDSVTMSYYGKVNDEVQYITDAVVFTNQNILPSMSGETVITAVMIIIGIIIMIPFVRHEKGD